MSPLFVGRADRSPLKYKIDIGQGCKTLSSSDIAYSFHADKHLIHLCEPKNSHNPHQGKFYIRFFCTEASMEEDMVKVAFKVKLENVYK